MESAVVQYLLHIAPSLAVCIILLARMDARLQRDQESILSMLTECHQRLFAHLENEQPPKE